jgi:hypothetical protein
VTNDGRRRRRAGEDGGKATLEANVGDLTCGVLGLEDLLRTKRASARPQDLADVAALERLQRLT